MDSDHKVAINANDAKQLKPLSFKIQIKVYGRSLNTSNSHSYLVDDVPTGTSSVIGDVNVDIRLITLKQLRRIIQFDRSGHMDRRSLLFQEALFIMSRLPNYYNRPNNELNKYLFGFIKKGGKGGKNQVASDIDSFDGFRLVRPDEEEAVISDLMGAADFFDHDLLIVPLSQIPP